MAIKTFVNGIGMDEIYHNGSRLDEMYMNGVIVHKRMLELIIPQQSGVLNLRTFIDSNNPTSASAITVVNNLTQPSIRTGDFSGLNVTFVNNGEIQGLYSGSTALWIESTVTLTNNGSIKGSGGDGGKGGDGGNGEHGADGQPKTITYTVDDTQSNGDFMGGSFSTNVGDTLTFDNDAIPGISAYVHSKDAQLVIVKFTGPCGQVIFGAVADAQGVANLNMTGATSGGGWTTPVEPTASDFCGVLPTSLMDDANGGIDVYFPSGTWKTGESTESHVIDGGSGGAAGAGGSGGSGGSGVTFTNSDTSSSLGIAGTAGGIGSTNTYTDPNGVIHNGNTGASGGDGGTGGVGGTGGNWGSNGETGAVGETGEGVNGVTGTAGSAGSTAGKSIVGTSFLTAGSSVGTLSGATQA